MLGSSASGEGALDPVFSPFLLLVCFRFVEADTSVAVAFVVVPANAATAGLSRYENIMYRADLCCLRTLFLDLLVFTWPVFFP